MPGRLATRKKPKKAKDSTELVYELKVRADSTMSVFLGVFDEGPEFKGFSVEISPDPKPLTAVTVEASKVTSKQGVKYFMNIANESDRAIHAKIFRV